MNKKYYIKFNTGLLRCKNDKIIFELNGENTFLIESEKYGETLNDLLSKYIYHQKYYLDAYENGNGIKIIKLYQLILRNQKIISLLNE